MTQPTSTILIDETGQVSNFRRNPETGDLYDASGLGDNVRQITSTQATPPAPAGESAHAYRQPGAGATNDDSGINTPGKNFSEANFAYNNLIQPQPNILDNYASYTYNLSLYMLTPAQATDVLEFNITNPASWSLLMASGGAGDSKRDQAPNGAPAGRNKYFKNDFYLDNLVINSNLFNNTGSPHDMNELSFSVFEPSGITLLPCLGNAFTDLMKNAKYDTGLGVPNLQTALYCFVITFYGYDINGKLTKVGTAGSTLTTSVKSNSQAIVEKIIPFTITNFTYKVINKGTTEYQIKGSPLGAPPLKTDIGSIKMNAMVIGETLGDILSGPKETSATNGPGERISSPSVSNTSANAPDPTSARESVAGYSNLF